MASSPVRNHFATEPVAARYAWGRPEFHDRIVESLRAHLDRDGFATALDVGCGTGASTRPLTRFTRRVIGLDPSLPMLARAHRAPQPSYVAGWAEALPFRSGTFDLLTVSQAFHWFERERFLAEALRLLDPTGLLVIYDSFFAGSTVDPKDEGRLGSWMRENYWRRYPYPPRSSFDFAPGEDLAPGFRCESRDEHQVAMELTRERLVDYLVTQTNVIAAVDECGQDIDVVRGWLLRELAPFFVDSGSRMFVFEGPIWFLRPHRGA